MPCNRVQKFIDAYCKNIEYTFDCDDTECHDETCQHLQFLKPDYTDLNPVVKVLKGNEIYRVAEAWNGCSIVRAHLKSDAFKNTILHDFILKNPKKRATGVLWKTIKEFQKKFNFAVPDDSTLVVHLRTGDNLRFFADQDKLVKRVKDYLEKTPTIDNITVVTALHYGVAQHKSLYEHSKKRRYGYANKWIYSDLSKKVNYDKIKCFIKKFNKPVFIQSSENVDMDLIFLIFAKHMIATSGGNFTTLINEIHGMVGT